MNVVTAEMMRALDRRAMEEFGIPGAVLMENAGRAVVDRIAADFGPLSGARVAVFCGTGNNGGDGFVIARHLRLLGACPVIYAFGDDSVLRADARTHFLVARNIGIPVVALHADPSRLPSSGDFDLAVDALLGTGIDAAPREPYARAIAHLNGMRLPVISVDVPSGVSSDTGEVLGYAVRATLTVTFGYPKLGLYLPPGSDSVGRLHVADIGFPWDGLAVETPYSTVGPEEIAGFAQGCRAPDSGFGAPFRARAPEANKGDFGHVLIVAGSRGMVGAPALVARAAQRSGAGLVTVMAPASAQPAIAAKLDEQMTVALPEVDGALTEEGFEAIAGMAAKATVLCIGPGLTTAPGVVELVHRLLLEVRKPVVLDADGLNALQYHPGTLAERFARFASYADEHNTSVVITPHPGEAARLLGTSTSAVQSNRAGAVIELARQYHAVAVLKGRFTMTSDPTGAVRINTTGNPGMATGGSGDVLAGVIAGLLAQAFAGVRSRGPGIFSAHGCSPETLVAAGVYLHGAAGDLAARDIGETGMVAGDILERLPPAIRLLEGLK